MSVYPDGEFLPLPVRVALYQLEHRALTDGLKERQAPPAAAKPPTSQTPDGSPDDASDDPQDGFGDPSAPRQTLAASAQRIWRYRALAALVSLVCAGAFVVLGLAIVLSDLSIFAALATLAVFGFALTLLEAWALPSVYRWVYWRFLLATWQ